MFSLNKIFIVLAAAACSGWACIASAALALPDDPINAPDAWTRSSVNTTFAEWQSFSSAYLGTNAPTSSFGDTVPNFQQTKQPQFVADPFPTFSIVLASSGNLYAPGATMDLQVEVPHVNLGPDSRTDVILQVLAQGPGISAETVKLDGGSPDVIDSFFVETVEVQPGIFADIYANWYKWNDLHSSSGNYQVTFSSLANHTSLDAVAIDTRSIVPEPACLGVTVLAGAMLLGRLRF